MRQLVAESLLLSAIAAACGIALARWGIAGIVALAPSGVLRLHEASIDGRALLIAAGLTTLTAVAFGLLPALQVSRPEHDPMRDRSGGAPRRAFRRGLVAAEVAFAVVLLTGAGLLIRSFDRLTAVDPGFSAAGVVELQVFVYGRDVTPERTRDFFTSTIERIRALPGVRAAGAVSAMPFAAANIDVKSALDIVGRPAGTERERRGVYVTIATPGYFEAMRFRCGRGGSSRTGTGSARRRSRSSATRCAGANGRPRTPSASASACSGRAGRSKSRSSGSSTRSATMVSTACRGPKCSCRSPSSRSAR